MRDFNLNQWLEDTAQMIADELKDTDPNEYVDAFWDLLHQEIDRAVIYYADAVAIVSELGFFNGYKSHELAPFDNISQIAYAGLYDEASEKMEPKVMDDIKTVLVEIHGTTEEIKGKE